MAARVIWSASFPLLSISMTPFCSNSHWTEPDSPSLPPCLVNVERISDTVRLRLSVATSAITATPPAAWPSYRMLSGAAASPPPVAFSIARWMFSRGMFTPRARSMASRSRKFPSGSPPPSFAASMISLVIFVKTTPRFASAAPFWRLIWLHFECPDMARNTINALGGLRPPYPAREQRIERTWGGGVPVPYMREGSMASPEPTKIRDVAVVGHGGSGKTSLVESILHSLGATTRLGKVDEGTSILDTDPEEQKRHITINMALASFSHEGTKINLLDTPGYADFAGDQRAALRVADAALVFVDASAGVQVGTQLVWTELERTGMPRIVVVGRLDRENADFDAVLGQLRETYGIRVVPLHVPLGEHQDLRATIDLLHGQVLRGPKDPVAELPKEESERVGGYRQQLVETIADPFVGKLSYVRVYSGTLHPNTQIYDATKKETERVGQLFFLRGKEQEPTDAVSAGDICAIPKLTATTTSATLCDKDAAILYPPIELPQPSFAVAIEPVSKADLDKLSTALHKLTDEDPTLHVRREDATHETLLSAIGESAVEVAVHRLKDKFGVQVDMHTPRVPYRESIRGKAQAQGRYKRQTGGHGQFGDVWLEIEPQPAGTGVVFETHVAGGSVPRNFWPAVEKGAPA